MTILDGQLFPESAYLNSGLTVPATTKTAAASTDFFIGVDTTDVQYKITKDNLLAGVGGGGGGGGGGSVSSEYFAEVAFLAHFTGGDGSTIITDVKGSTITRVGNSSISTTQSKFGQGSLFLDGSGDYLTFPRLPIFDICSGDDFKLEFFYYPIQLTGFRALIAQWRQSAGSAGFLLASNGSTLEFHFGAFSEASALLFGGTLITNTWQHIAIIRINSEFTLWLNGVEVARAYTLLSRLITSVNYSVGNYHNPSGVLGAIGATDVRGYYNELRITKPRPYTFDVPSQGFPDSVYVNSGFPVPMTTGSTVDYRFDDNTGQQLSDYSGNNLHGILGDTSGAESTDPLWISWASAGLDFIPNDFVTMPTRNWFPGNFYVECAIFIRSYRNWSRIFDFSSTVNPTNNNVYLSCTEGTNGRPELKVGNASTSTKLISSLQIPIYTWVHVSVGYNSGEASIFINNSLVARSACVAPPNTPLNRCWLGRSNYTADDFLDGVIASFSAYNRFLTNAERTNNYLSTKARLESRSIII